MTPHNRHADTQSGDIGSTAGVLVEARPDTLDLCARTPAARLREVDGAFRMLMRSRRRAP